MRVLQVGSNGYVGKRVVAALKAVHHHVRAFVRRPPASDLAADEVVVGDVLDRASVARAVASMDAVVSTVEGYYAGGFARASAWETNTTGVCNVIELAEQHGARRFVFASIVGCDRGSPADHIRSKVIVEDRLAKSALDWVSVRAPFLLDEASEFYGQRLRKGAVTCFGSPDLRCSMLLSDQFVEALVTAVAHRELSRETVDVVWERDVSPRELARLFEHYSGRPIRIQALPWLPTRALLLALGTFSRGQRNFRHTVEFVRAGKFIGDPTQTRRLLDRSLDRDTSIRAYVAARGLTATSSDPR